MGSFNVNNRNQMQYNYLSFSSHNERITFTMFALLFCRVLLLVLFFGYQICSWWNIEITMFLSLCFPSYVFFFSLFFKVLGKGLSKGSCRLEACYWLCSLPGDLQDFVLIKTLNPYAFCRNQCFSPTQVTPYHRCMPW